MQDMASPLRPMEFDPVLPSHCEKKEEICLGDLGFAGQPLGATGIFNSAAHPVFNSSLYPSDLCFILEI